MIPMKLQEASRKEALRISKGVLILDGVMIAGLFLLSQFGLGKFDIVKVLLGTAIGSVISIANFIILCLTIQGAVNFDDQKKMRSFIQGSYNGRLALQALWVVICIIVPQIHVLAGAAPLLFPNLTIIYLQLKGKLVEPSERKNPPAEDEEEPEDYLGPLEV